MELTLLKREDDCKWVVEPHDRMRVPGVIYATEQLVRDMDEKAYEQVCNVAMLPGIQVASYAMPDAHWGYGFPIGGVAAFDADEGGVISAGGVGLDISCGVRTLETGLTDADIEPLKKELANDLYRTIPAGVGSEGAIELDDESMDAMLQGGAAWAVNQGYGRLEDLERTEERGCMAGAEPSAVSDRAKQRQRREMGTLGSGNHYLEVQRVAAVFDEPAAAAFGLRQNDVVVSIHCGSRGLGHQIGTDYLREMVLAAPEYGIELPDRELACAPIRSPLGERYLGAMRAGINCALANRQIITHLARKVFARAFPTAELRLLYDVSHNTCKLEEHAVNGVRKNLYVHRKGATRSYAPHHADLGTQFGDAGQPVLIGGTMGTASYVLAGTDAAMSAAFGSACHGAGRAMSRHAAYKQWFGRQVIDELASRGIVIRAHSNRGVAEEAPGAYKDVQAVVDAAHEAGLAKKVARLEPLVCIKG